MSYRVQIVFVVALLISAPAFGGKLSSVRSKTRKPSPAPAKSSTPEPEDEPERAPEPARRKPSEPSTTKLADVRARTRRPSPPAARPTSNRRPRPHRPSPQRPHRAPRRSARGRSSLGLHFSSAFRDYGPTVGPAFGPAFDPDFGPATIVEEHHYYPVQGVVSQPAFGQPVFDQPNAYSANSFPSVMPPEPAVVRGQPLLDPCNDPNCEAASATDEFVCLDSDSPAMVIEQDAWMRPFHLRFEIDYASDQDDVSRTGFGLLANMTGGLGVDTGVRLFREQDADARDHMWVGDFNVIYELFPTEYVRTRAGVGVSFLADHYGSDAGLNLTVGTDVFMGPVTLSGEMDLGTIGDTDLFHGRATVALRQGEHVEWFAGYDHLDIGGVEFSGFVAGMRFRY